MPIRSVARWTPLVFSLVCACSAAPRSPDPPTAAVDVASPAPSTSGASSAPGSAGEGTEPTKGATSSPDDPDGDEAGVAATTPPEDPPDPSAPTASGSGKKAPSFTLTTLSGSGHATITPKKVVVVAIWASFCAPCTRSLPAYQKLYVTYKDKGLDVVAISADEDAQDASAFVSGLKLTFPVAWDKDGKVLEKWKPATMPTTYVVDKQGLIRHEHRGYADGDAAALEAEIKALLGI